jgi:hypothetical protein
MPKKQQRFVIPEGEHSPLGPSASERWLECTASVLATMDLPDKSSQYAIEGTAAHTVSEWARLERRDAEEYIGREVEVQCADGSTVVVVVDQTMADGVNAFVEYTDALPGEMLCEERVTYDGWVPKGFGTADDIRLASPVVSITDFKYGQGVQKWAKDNTQLMLYALGVWQDYGWMYDIKEFRLAIFQPRLRHIDEWTISVEDLLVWANTVAKPKAEEALTPGAGVWKAGEHCQFCRMKTNCKTRVRYMADVIYAKDLDEFEDLDKGVLPDPIDANTISLDELGLLLPMLDVVKSVATDLEARAYAELGKGNKITHPITGDYKLVEGRSNRCFALPEGELVTVLKAEGLTEDDIYKKSLNGVPAIEKRLGKKHRLITGDPDHGSYSIITKPKGKPKLVPGTDPRQSMEISAEDEFDDVN